MGGVAAVAVEAVGKWAELSCPLSHNLPRDFSRHCQKGQIGSGYYFGEVSGKGLSFLRLRWRKLSPRITRVWAW